MSTSDIMNDFSIVWDSIKKKIPISKNSTSFSRVKTFIACNPDDPKSIIIKNYFVELFNKEFSKDEIVHSLNIPDDYKYYKTVELFKTLPFLYHKDDTFNYFYATIQHGSEYFGEYYKFVKGCLWFLKKEGKCEVDEEVMKKISKYTCEYRNIFGLGASKYDDYNTELNRLKSICNGEYPDDFNSFRQGIEYDYRVKGISNWNIDDVIRDYKASKIGIVGEYDALKYVLPMEGNFVAKDFGNGFGYDMYYNAMGFDGKRVEILIEVKSTMNLNGDDYFNLSDNEYEVLMDAVDRSNSHYVLSRVFVDLNKNEHFDTKLLIFDKENNRFVSTNNDDGNIIEYRLDKDKKGHCFKRSAITLGLKKSE